MPVFLKEVQIENFKSFSGRFILGPFRRFTSITGPNGAGKSNLMDAIAFSLGEKSSNLRARSLMDLVNKQVTPNCDRNVYVATTFELANGNEKEFKRMIKNNKSEYLIDEEVVAQDRYIDELKHLGVHMSLKNCFVYQGFVEDIARASPKELTDFFEKVSGSLDHKENYNHLQKELIDMVVAYVNLKKQKSQLEKFKTNISTALELNKKMDDLKSQADQYEMELLLIDFMILEREKNAIHEKKNLVIAEEEELNDKIQAQKFQIQHLRNEKIDLQKTEEAHNEKIAQIYAKHEEPFKKFLDQCEKINYHRDRLLYTKKILQSHEEDEKQRQLTIQNLEQELEDCLFAKNQYSQDSTVSSQIVEDHKREYDKLQQKVMKKTLNIQRHLDRIFTEYREVMEKLENKSRIKMDIERKIQAELEKLEIDENRRINMLNIISEIEKKLEKSREDLEKFLDDTTTYDAIKLKLEETRNHLNSLRLTKPMRNTVENERKIFNELKENIPNVYGRMYNLCKPIHPRYQVAMTRIFGKNLSAIVVDNNTTARKCIKYLRANELGRETFLPLADLCGFPPLKVHLREMGGKIGIHDLKLLYDVIDFPPEIAQAVLFVVGNRLVCDKLEHAKRVAWKLPNSKYDCIALDGTYFQKTGIFSGGQVTLAEKSQKFDASAYGKAKNDYEVALNAFRDFECPLMDEMDVDTKRLETHQIETQLERHRNWLSKITEDLSKTENEIYNLRVQLTEMEKDQSLEERKEQLLQEKMSLKDKIHEIENKIYAKFCSQLNIKSIHNFFRDLELFRDKQTKLTNIDKHCDLIRAQLEYENSRDKTAVIESLQASILSTREKLDEVDCDVETEKERLIAVRENELRPWKETLEDLQNEIAKLTKDREAAEAKLKQLLKARRSAREKQKTMSDKLLGIFHRHQSLALQAKITFGRNGLPLLSDSSSMSSDSKYAPMDDMGFHKSEWMEFDFSILPNEVREANDSEILVIQKKHKEKLQFLHEEIVNMNVQRDHQFTSMDIDDKLRNVKEKLKSHWEDSKKLQKEFDEVKKLRYDRFVDCFDRTAASINQIYQQITRSTAAHADLLAENPEEPFLAGIRYNCMPGKKRSANLGELSGGELTLAGLSLILAVKSTPTSPFLFLDEPAVSLDKFAVQNLISFLNSPENSRQIFIISHNPRIFGNTDDIIVNYRVGNNGSNIMTNLVMTSFKEHYLPVTD